MGGAILGGWIESRIAPADSLGPKNFTVVEHALPRRRELHEAYGVQCVADADAVSQADIVVLAVKPQVMFEVLEDLRALPAFGSCLFLSIAAGIPTDRLVEALPPSSRLVRLMPNTPLLVGEGATAVCGSATSEEGDCALAKELFGCLGEAYVVDEGAIDAIGALSGSGPAYVAAFIEALVRAGVKQGLDEELAERLMVQTVLGTGKLLKLTGQRASEVREAVSSPGGTTLAALAAMGEAGLGEAYDKGVVAAVRRSEELGSC